uniref:Macoilin n=1 Tax=Oncorhynchus kisutch TaxID=8019 RepID=A0A8C7J606_ONCKI
MKRRNADCSKLRRPLKRNRITEGIYSSTFLYLKFLVVWVLVLLADFVLEFRFEYLWPFWLFIRSVYDSFRYQGLAFSVFFVCVAFTTYVWVQYVWHTERGVCLPTVSLWILFVYMEAAIRFKDLKNFHVDLCRPFAAHCIGYPVVTLGFGFKSYVSYRMRLRKQKEMQKENEFYMQLLQQALPPEQQMLQRQEREAEEGEALSLFILVCTDSLFSLSGGECTDSLRGRIRELETECKKLSIDMKLKEEHIRELEGKCQELRKYKENEKDMEVLMSALSAMQDKTQHLENSLSAETRIKLDLFSALGDAKRQLEIAQGQIHQRDQEIAELKRKIAEVMAVMPSISYSNDSSSLSPVTPHYSSKFMDNSPSSLDPNASVYQPLKK